MRVLLSLKGPCLSQPGQCYLTAADVTFVCAAKIEILPWRNFQLLCDSLKYLKAVKVVRLFRNDVNCVSFSNR